MKFITVILLLVSVYAKAQINWISFEELPQLMRNEPKKVFIFLETDWCKYCKMMKLTTFEDTAVINQLNKDYYCLRFNAESKKEVTFLGKIYAYNTSGEYAGKHQLAVFLGKANNQLQFPTSVFLDTQFQLHLRLSIYLSPKDFLEII